MSYLRGRAATLIAAGLLTLGLGAGLAAAGPAGPASALVFTEQCDLANGCANLWGGGFAVAVYYGTTHNNEIAVQWINAAHTQFELRDNIHGGCIANLNNSPSNARAGGGQSCPSSGDAAWGSIFETAPGCVFAGYTEYHSRHWPGGYLGWEPNNGDPAYLNTPGHCVQQRS